MARRPAPPTPSATLPDPSATLPDDAGRVPDAPAALERVTDPWGLDGSAGASDAADLEELDRLRLEVAELRARAMFAQERASGYGAPLETALGDALRVALTAWGFRFGFGVVREVALEVFDRWEASGHE